MRFPRHLGTGDYLSGLLGISCVCEVWGGQGASTLFAREPWQTQLTMCVPMSAWSEDYEEIMSQGKGGVH